MKKYFTLFAIIIISSFTIVNVVSAATTISTDIQTDGQLSVTGTSTLVGITKLMGNVIFSGSQISFLKADGSTPLSIVPNSGSFALQNASTTVVQFYQTGGGPVIAGGNNLYFGTQAGLPTYFGSNSVGQFGINVPMTGGCPVGCSPYFNVLNPDIALSDNASIIAHDIVGGSFGGFSTAGTAGTYGGLTIQGGPGVGTSTAGSDLALAGGRGTGTANGGSIIFYTTPAGGSAGASLNSQTELARFTSAGNFGIGIANPTTQFQVATTTANATTTIQIGKSGQSKGSCLVMYDNTGAVKYVSIIAGAFSISSTQCN